MLFMVRASDGRRCPIETNSSYRAKLLGQMMLMVGPKRPEVTVFPFFNYTEDELRWMFWNRLKEWDDWAQSVGYNEIGVQAIRADITSGTFRAINKIGDKT